MCALKVTCRILYVPLHTHTHTAFALKHRSSLVLPLGPYLVLFDAAMTFSQKDLFRPHLNSFRADLEHAFLGLKHIGSEIMVTNRSVSPGHSSVCK